VLTLKLLLPDPLRKTYTILNKTELYPVLLLSSCFSDSYLVVALATNPVEESPQA